MTFRSQLMEVKLCCISGFNERLQHKYPRVGFLFVLCVKPARQTWMRCGDTSGSAALCQQRGITPSPAEAAGNSWMLNVPGAELLGLCSQGNKQYPLLPKSLGPLKNSCCACHGLQTTGFFLVAFINQNNPNHIELLKQGDSPD